MIDAHAHVHDEQFDVDRDEVMHRAFGSGVSHIILVGTDEISNKKAVSLAEKYENVFALVAFHPYEYNALPGDDARDSWIRGLKDLSNHPKVVGIGECGLDYHSHTGKPITNEQKKAQKDGFLVHLELAQIKQIPLVIHTRSSSRTVDDAYRDILDILAQRLNGMDQKIILHGYQGSTQITEEFLKLSYVYFSFAGNITYPIKKALRDTQYDIQKVVKMVPIERILTETDSPYLAPQPVRGSRNEPVNVRYVAEEIARIKGLGLTEVSDNTTELFMKTFIKKFS